MEIFEYLKNLLVDLTQPDQKRSANWRGEIGAANLLILKNEDFPDKYPNRGQYRQFNQDSRVLCLCKTGRFWVYYYEGNGVRQCVRQYVRQCVRANHCGKRGNVPLIRR